MKYFDWNNKKNELLKLERDVSFEDIQIAIKSGKLLDVIVHPNKKKYSKQKMFVVSINNYAYLVPFVENKDSYFLKTVFPSRKLTKKYLTKSSKK